VGLLPRRASRRRAARRRAPAASASDARGRGARIGPIGRAAARLPAVTGGRRRAAAGVWPRAAGRRWRQTIRL